MITFFRLRPFFFNDCVLFFFANREHEKIDAFDMVSCTFSGLKSSVESAEREEICDRKSLKSFFFWENYSWPWQRKRNIKRAKNLLQLTKMFPMRNYGHSICCYITVMRNIRMKFSAVIQLNKYQTLCSKLHIIHSEISRYYWKETRMPCVRWTLMK